MGQGQSMPNWMDEDTIGTFDFDMCCVPFTSTPGQFTEGAQVCTTCCPAMAAPSGPEWDAAKGPKWDTLLQEAETICKESGKGCCGQCWDVRVLKRALEAQWASKADEYLAEFDLKVKIFAVQSDKSAQMGIQIVKNPKPVVSQPASVA
eukprot:CAMPEP_0182558346 /NCGR_PEP_ID=MMETSP1324-20130603/1918_1 /TAXON_ID=236786 /ORGANISM="Florenciella sp., Strain RCC1587" /LENGTH=148 /DNA_ID=CAMNT_0024770513 /DNA_START=102 /DNA_END=548 /DNA_ORIENTATION=+